MNSQPSQTTQAKPDGQKSNLALIIILVIVGFVIVLGVGGYFGWKYYKAKISSSASTSSATISPATNTTSNDNTSAPPAATTGSTAKTGTMPTNSFVIIDSNTRLITEADLTSLTPWQLKVARNEIYARYGREFVHKDLQCYFGAQSWYKIDSAFTESMLSGIDNKNVATIQAYEQKINSPLQSKDSGC